MSETLLTFLIAAVAILPPLVVYLRSLKKREERARAAAEKGKLYSEGPKAQHPRRAGTPRKLGVKFLMKLGLQFGVVDVTKEASAEAHNQALARRS